jgi:predicted MFS family arabinose efflux permease
MPASASAIENAPPKRRFLLGLLSAVFAVNVIDVFVRLLLPEIAATFSITRGVASQLGTFSALAGVITGLALSAFSIVVRYKTLLTGGVLCTLVCVLGVYLAPNFLFAQVFYALNGVGSVIVGVMAPVLIGELYPLEKKAVRVSWIAATAMLALVIGSPITGFIANTGIVTSWLNALLWFMVPTTALCTLLVVLFVPSKPPPTRLGVKREPFMQGYKQVLTNKSARAALTNSFFAGVFLAASFFAAAFLADVFRIDPFVRGLLPILSGSLAIAGMLVGGALVNRIGRKRLLVNSAIPAIIFSVAGYPLSIFIPNMWVVLSLRFIAAFIGGFPLVAGPNFALELVPKFRGTMLSIGSALSGIGGAFGIFLAGRMLDFVNYPVIGYPIVMVTLGALGTVGILTILIFAKDPVVDQPKPPQPT